MQSVLALPAFCLFPIFPRHFFLIRYNWHARIDSASMRACQFSIFQYLVVELNWAAEIQNATSRLATRLWNFRRDWSRGSATSAPAGGGIGRLIEIRGRRVGVVWVEIAEIVHDVFRERQVCLFDSLDNTFGLKIGTVGDVVGLVVELFGGLGAEGHVEFDAHGIQVDGGHADFTGGGDGGGGVSQAHVPLHSMIALAAGLKQKWGIDENAPISHPPCHPDEAHMARMVLFSFLVMFLASRMTVYLIMAHKIPDLYLHLGGNHIHHLNYGIFLLVAVGAFLLFRDPTGRALKICAVGYGIGLALTFDEFGMWVRLDGSTYWQRASVDAIGVLAAVLGLLAYAPTVKRFRPHHWWSAALLLVLLVLFFVMMIHSAKYAQVRLGPMFEQLEAGQPK